ncbi:hypothetical protein SteCoe_22495 [Stentor coeruleus]|uniref:PDEase domain-containing protein n=1 Tax=Stentor coeruleus TaxID=5963 RepID=A0A1R2BM73_9CILI|nr:hypothetical protein SteCoe_22495 [Stentor coeruleus]
MAGKLPDCLGINANNEEAILSMKSTREYYEDIMHPFKIRESLAPSLEFCLVNLQKPCLIADISVKDFPVFSHTVPDLVYFAFEIFRGHGLDEPKLSALLDMVSKNYFQTTPFHNFWHGFSVMQMIYCISERNTKLSDFITDKEYTYLLLAAIGHDICHPGMNNSFLIATKHELSIKYNNISVLENHHASVILEMIKISEIFSSKTLKKLSPIILEVILSTDMARHKQVCDEYINTLENFDKTIPNHRQKFMNYLLHCSDLGNQTLDFPLASIWSMKVLQEFNYQVVCEENAGIRVSEFMRTGNNMVKVKNSQIGFIENIILPLWNGLAKYVKNIDDFPEGLKKNKKRWEEIQEFK